MHNYPPFEMKDDEEKTAFISARRFCNLIISGTNGPIAAHVPLLLRKDPNGKPMLEGHLARSNPLITASHDTTPALAIFNGNDAYITPSLYESKKRHGKVAPTWNYIAVHASGRLTTFTDPNELRAQINDLTDTMETGLPAPWAVDDAPADFTDKLLTAITGIRITIETLEGIRKLNQNQRQDDQTGVRNGLANSPDPAARQLATEMEKQP